MASKPRNRFARAKQKSEIAVVRPIGSSAMIDTNGFDYMSEDWVASHEPTGACMKRSAEVAVEQKPRPKKLKEHMEQRLKEGLTTPLAHVRSYGFHWRYVGLLD